MPADISAASSRSHRYVLTAMVAAAYAVWTVRAGIHVSVDTNTYSRWADLLIAHHFNISEYLHESSFVVPPVLYLLWIVVVASLKTVLGSSWTIGVVTLNWMALTSGVYLTLAAVDRTTASKAGLFLSALLFLVAGDLLIFVPFVLSDLIFWGFSTTVVVLGLTIAANEERAGSKVRQVIAGSVLTLIALAFRPSAVPLAAFWVVAVACAAKRDLLLRFAVPLFGVVVLLAFATIGAHAYVLMHPTAWPFGPLPGMLDLLGQEYRAGVLVYAPESNFTVAPATDWLAAIRLTIEKSFYFLTPWLPHYSRAHTAINLAFFVPAYGLSAAALANVRRLTDRQQVATWLLALLIVFVTVFHALMQIDYDHRYRLPLLPALVMLAAIGLESVRRPRTLASTGRTR
jgi:hypothetical protein